MLLISKKKMIFIISSILTSFLCYELILSNNIENKDNIVNMYEKTLAVNAVPVTNKVIVVDAGHGNPDGGAVGNTGIKESDINLKIALKLQKILEENGAIVILTRSDENGIYDNDTSSIRNKKASDIRNRVKIGNESHADIFVSIHLNKLDEKEYDGWQTFYNKKSKESKRLAECLQQGLNESIKKENNRKAKSIENIYITNNVEIPTSIVECGFLSNYEEEKKLRNELYQENLAYGIYVGIMNYFYE